jgi:hypothetical protein
VAFVTDDEDAHGVSLTIQDQKPPGRNLSHITCHSCGKQGHYAPQCPDRKAKAAKSNQSGEQLLQDGVDIMEFTNDRFQFLQVAERCSTNLNTSNDRRILSSWILLDNQSTIDVFHNASLL